MSDVNAIINIDINSSAALLNLKRLENQIDQFNRSVATSNATAAASQQSLNRALVDGINNTGLFTSKIVPVESSMTRFSRSLDEGRLSLGEYTRYASSQLPGLSRVFKKEFDSIEQVATSRVKSMQTQYLALGKTVDGVTRTIASTPTGLSKGFSTDIAMAQQRQQLFNKLLDDGSTKLLNFGKNTQWAGRQLMVGFSLPLAAFGAVAAKTFMEIDKATTSLKRVYGDLSTTKQELDSNVQAVKGLGKEYTKYGITLAETIALSGRAAATGATNEKLMAATEQTLRFATLGQMDYNQALDTTISLQTAFAISNEDLGKTVDYLNAVENQTILTMEDMSVAIPRVATVVKGLGGSVQDLAVMMTAMREGGVSAENAANGLKSGLASLINPTKRASESLGKMGVNLNSIINQNKGDLMGIVTEFGTAINKLDEFSRQQVLEQVFGKFQYARMSALFTNITKDAGQAARAMDIAGMSASDLAKISEKELGQISESTSVKFQAAMEQLKISIAPIGEAFLKGITPVVNMVSKIAEAFNSLPDSVKNSVAVLTGLVAGLGPVFLMTIGLLGNGLANIVKGFQFFRKTIAGIKGDASAFTYLAQGELEAVTASKALEGSSTMLTDKLLLQRGAVAGLTAEYERFSVVAGIAGSRMGGMGGGKATNGTRGRPSLPPPRGFATGGTIPGSGNTDTVPAMLTPGEFVINKKATAQNLPLLHAINDGKGMGGFNKGGQIPGVQYFATENKPRIVQPVRGMGAIIQSLLQGIDRPGRRAPSSFKTVQRKIYEPIESSIIQQIFELGGGDAGYKVSDSRKRWMQTHVAHLAPRTSQTSVAWKASNLKYTSGAENLTLNDIFSRGMLNPEKKQFIESIAKENGLEKILKKVLQDGHHPNTQKEYKALETLLGSMKEQKGFKSIFKSVDDQANVSMLLGLTRVRNNPSALPSLGANSELFTGNLRSIDELLKDPDIKKLLGVQSHNNGGPILGGKVTQSRPFYGVFNAKTIDMFKKWIGTHSEAIPALRQTILKDPKMKSMFGSAFLKSKEPETLLRSQFMSSVPEIGSELSLGALRSFSAEGTDVIRHLADSRIRKEAEHASYELGVDQKRQKRNAARLRKAETVGLPSWSPEHKYRSPVGGATGIDAWMEDTRWSIEQGKSSIKKSKSKIRDYRKLTPTIIRLKTPAGTIRANIDDIVPQIEQQYGTSGSSYQVQEQERILNNARIKVSGKSTDKNGITTLDAELIESFGLNKGGMLFASNGKTVPGVGNTDTVPAMLTPGEFVINKQATQSNLPLLHAINNGQTVKKNKGGMIDGVQYFAEGGEAQSDRGSASGSGAYKAETRRIMAVGWDSLQTEILILEAMRDNNKLTQSQFDAFSQGETSHITPEVGPNGGKMWRPSNMMADLGLINNYIEAQKGTSKKALGNAKLFGEIQSKTSLSAERLRAELDLLSRGFHATTKESAMALRALSQVGDQTAQKIAVSRVLDARLQGTFYDTLNAPERQYRSDLPTEEKFGKRGNRSKPDRNIPQPETRDPMRPPKLSAQEADKIKRDAEREARSSLGIAPHRGFSASQGGGGYDQNDVFIPQQTIDEESKKIRTREYDRRNKEHGREQARIIAVSRQSEMQQPTPPTSPDSAEIDANKQGKRAKMGRGMMKAGGTMSMLSMLPFMMQDQEGKFMGMDANMLGTGLMVGGMAMPAIGSAIGAGGGAGMLAGGGALAAIAPVLLPVAATAAAVGVGLALWRKNIDDNSRETASLTANLGVTANSVSEMGKILGKSTPQQRQAMQQLSLTKKDEQIAQETVIPQLQSEGGQKLLEQLKTMDAKSQQKTLQDYTTSAVATRMMSKEEASVFARAVGSEIGNIGLGAKLSGSIMGQKEGSGGMLDLTKQRMNAIESNPFVKQAMEASGAKDSITAAEASAVVGGSIQVFSDLSDTVALANEEYRDGRITFEKYNEIINISRTAQEKYMNMYVKANTGSMEQGGTRQAVADQLISSGKMTQDQYDKYAHGLDIGSTSVLGMDTAYVTNSLAAKSASDPAVAAAMKGTGKRKSLSKGGLTEVSFQTDADKALIESERLKSEKDNVDLTKLMDEGLQAKIDAAILSNQLTVEQAAQFQTYLISGTKEASNTIKTLLDGNSVAFANFEAAAKQQGMSQNYVNAVGSYDKKGGSIADASALLSSFSSVAEPIMSKLFEKLSFEQQSVMVKDQQNLSSILGQENQSKVQSSASYKKMIREGKSTDVFTTEARKAEASGIATSYGNVVATITARDNGEPMSSDEFANKSKKVRKALTDFEKGNSVVKKKAIISLLTQIEDSKGKAISGAQAQDMYDELIKTYGKKRIENLPTDVMTKVLEYRAIINDIDIKTMEQQKIFNDPNSTDDQRLAAGQSLMALGSARASRVAQEGEIISESPKGYAPPSSEEKGGGGAKDNPLLNLKKSILEQIKMYVDINATMKKLNDLKYKFSDMISGSNGVFDKLRGLKGTAGGLSDSVVDVIAGMGPDAAKAWMKKNAKGGKLTKEGQNQADLIFAGGVRGTIEGNLAEFRGARAQKRAYRNLRGRGLEDPVVEAIAGDPEKAKTLEGLQARVNAGIKGSAKDMNAFIDSQVKATKQAELLARAQDPIQTKIDDMTMAHKMTTSEIDKQIEGYQDKVDTINKEIEAIQKINSSDQNRIRDLDRQKEMINREIELLSRANELDQRRAEALKRQDEIRNRSSESLSHELDIMSQQETQIKDTYDKRIKALDEVAKINDYIVSQQKNQLGLAQALSQGDVYAAAAAREDIQAGTAKFAEDQMRASLLKGMENQVAGLTTAGGLTRDQAEAQIAAIKEQSYQTSLLIRDIEDGIYNRNLQMIPLKESQLVIDGQIQVIQDAMYARETEIIKIQDGKLAAAQSLLDKQIEIKAQLDKNFERSVSDLELQNDIRKMSDAQANSVNALAMEYGQVANQLGRINKIAQDKLTGFGSAPTKTITETSADFETRLKKWRDSVAAVEAERIASSKAVVASAPAPLGQGMLLATGGLIGDGARDSIPAMLTPGEFVMRKASVQKYGMPMLSSMNMGAFDMPKYNTNSQTSTAPTVQAPSVISSVTAPVYNTYSVSVNANTNASPDDIANKVIMKIKSIESRSIRSTNGY
jgi:TP901 family phage tail tape measure protein